MKVRSLFFYCRFVAGRELYLRSKHLKKTLNVVIPNVSNGGTTSVRRTIAGLISTDY